MKNKPYSYYNVPDVKTFREYLEHCERDYSEKTAFSFHRKKQLIKKSYTEFHADVKMLAVRLIELGYSKSRIAVMGENSYEWILVYFAAVTSGNVIVPIDKELPIEQVCFILEETGVELFVCSDTYSDYANEIKEQIHKIEIADLQNSATNENSGGGGYCLIITTKNIAA